MPIFTLMFLLCTCSSVAIEEPSLPTEDNDDPTQDVLIFGLDYLECGGDCAFIFKLEANQLFEDDDVNFITSLDQELTFLSTPRRAEDFELAKQLLEEFPEQLMEIEPGLIGNPNNHDQGGITIEIHRAGTVKRWYVDTVTRKQPDFLVPYTQKLTEIVNQLIED